MEAPGKHIHYRLQPGDIDTLLHIPLERTVKATAIAPGRIWYWEDRNLDPHVTFYLSSKGALHSYVQRDGFLGVLDAIALFFIKLFTTTDPKQIAAKFYSLVKNETVQIAVIKTSNDQLLAIQRLAEALRATAKHSKDPVYIETSLKLKNRTKALKESSREFQSDMGFLCEANEIRSSTPLMKKIQSAGGLEKLHPNVIHALARHVKHIQASVIPDPLVRHPIDIRNPEAVKEAAEEYLACYQPKYPIRAHSFMQMYKMENIDFTDAACVPLIKNLSSPENLSLALTAYNNKQSYIHAYDILSKPGFPGILLNPYREVYSDAQLRNMEEIGALIPVMEDVLQKTLTRDPEFFIAMLREAAMTPQLFDTPSIRAGISEMVLKQESKTKVLQELEQKHEALDFAHRYSFSTLAHVIRTLEARSNIVMTTDLREYEVLNHSITTIGSVLQFFTQSGIDLATDDRLIDFILAESNLDFSNLDDPLPLSLTVYYELPLLMDNPSRIAELQTKWKWQQAAIKLADGQEDRFLIADDLTSYKHKAKDNAIIRANLEFLGSIICNMQQAGYSTEDILSTLNRGYEDGAILQPLINLDVDNLSDDLAHFYAMEREFALFAKDYPDSPISNFLSHPIERDATVMANLETLYYRILDLQLKGFGPEIDDEYGPDLYYFLVCYGLDENGSNLINPSFEDALTDPYQQNMALFDFMKLKVPHTYALGINYMKADKDKECFSKMHLISIPFIKYGRLGHKDAEEAQKSIDPSRIIPMDGDLFKSDLLSFFAGENPALWFEENELDETTKPATVRKALRKITPPSSLTTEEPSMLSRVIGILSSRNASNRIETLSVAPVSSLPAQTSVEEHTGPDSNITVTRNRLNAFFRGIRERLAHKQPALSSTDDRISLPSERPIDMTQEGSPSFPIRHIDSMASNRSSEASITLVVDPITPLPDPLDPSLQIPVLNIKAIAVEAETTALTPTALTVVKVATPAMLPSVESSAPTSLPLKSEKPRSLLERASLAVSSIRSTKPVTTQPISENRPVLVVTETSSRFKLPKVAGLFRKAAKT
ncbi:MAG: hypothetical protein HY860_06980 [Chlamydiales bacterium]|nr:hypothetical protein [Chlamydiales bacterium]